MNKAKLNELNIQIEAARKAVIEAEFEGVRGQAMLDLKANVHRLQAIHKANR